MNLKMIVPKGRLFDQVMVLMRDIGINIQGSERSYRPVCNDPDLSLKMLKSQNVPMLVGLGQHDCGFAGEDWIQEQSADVVRIMDLGFDPVKIVACIPEDWDWDLIRKRPLIAASEYKNLTRRFLSELGLTFSLIRSHGATEVFPPEDADLIVDNMSTGTTLRANRLKIVDTLMTSTTHFIAHPAAMDDPLKRGRIEDMAVLFRSVLEGRQRVLLEMNANDRNLDEVVALLPAMKAPTVSRLYKDDGYSVKAAVPRLAVRDLLPRLIQAGATDILETPIRKVVA